MIKVKDIYTRRSIVIDELELLENLESYHDDDLIFLSKLKNNKYHLMLIFNNEVRTPIGNLVEYHTINGEEEDRSPSWIRLLKREAHSLLLSTFCNWSKTFNYHSGNKIRAIYCENNMSEKRAVNRFFKKVAKFLDIVRLPYFLEFIEPEELEGEDLLYIEKRIYDNGFKYLLNKK